MQSGMHLEIHTHPLSDELGSRQTSLLPGQVRTPKYRVHSPITDWAATSSVFDDGCSARAGLGVNGEESHYPPSHTTPMTVYGQGDLWGNGGDFSAQVSCAFLDALEPAASDAPPAVEATSASPPTLPAASDTVSPTTAPDCPTSTASGASATSVECSVRAGVVSAAARAGPPAAFPPPAELRYTASCIKYHHHHHLAPHVASLKDVAWSIIAAAGLPLSIACLDDYITEGQLQLPQPPQAAQPSDPFAPTASPSRPVAKAAPARRKTQSESLSDLLYFHANFFPPPPPPHAPMQTRLSRAALWYHYASKWDIAHRMPPPPRSPLPEMELERREQLLSLSRAPYHSDRWLKICEHWFEVIRQQFNYPTANTAVPLSRSFVLSHVVVA
ncbi:pterin-4-alpha-carbinolamine dehydratase [Trypanosoma conorhini]|uniref:Pterin-4-alpha-carbinolamine dehydratase n=1 Tax=Trypanosoma conorhini TaxID=83891 RepID=A0A3R7KXY6_9TRYP|nr:pterin-4-alpha-carbinolamine dehydratase [Trypanosoma conorhini]RNF15655.1 pterin-4-alpha-carbinolamine dehydratase [Trypanosoma conorhini]